MYDPTDPAQVEAEERRIARELQRHQTDLRTVLSMPEGRRWLWRVLEQTAAFRASYDPDSPIRMAFAEGRRSTGLWLLAELQAAAPGEFAALIAEVQTAKLNPTDEDNDLT